MPRGVNGGISSRTWEVQDVNGRTRRARPEERGPLSALALRSKAHWGYEPGFMEACREALTLAPEAMTGGEVWVHERHGRVVGFFSLAKWNSDSELAHLFVEPAKIGRGVGRTLWTEAVRRAESLGYERMLIQSDPNAEGFYLKLGAERIGEVPSQVQAGRMLPLLLFALRNGSDEARPIP